jgi:uncharacterized protein YgbK (DUF1537 family)
MAKLKVEYMERILVVADDFTGANDVGAMFARRGCLAEVMLSDVAHLLPPQTSQVVQPPRIINTASRAVSSGLAAERVMAALRSQQSWQPDWVFKKIDSTLRGNIGAEVAAALQAGSFPFAVIAPALPASQRMVREGGCWVGQKQLLETEFATDPKTPVLSSSVTDILRLQTDLPLAELHLTTVREIGLSEKINQLHKSGVRLMVADAELQSDLDGLVSALRQLPEHALLVGSAGLAEAFAMQILPAAKPSRPLLAVIGSMSEIAQQQIAYAHAHKSLDIVELDITTLFPSSERARVLDQLCSGVLHVLQQSRHCVLRTCQSAGQRQSIPEFCQQQGITRQQLGDGICACIGQLMQRVLPVAPALGGLYLSGGDIAIAVAQALGAHSFQIKGQVASCVPWGTFIGGQLQQIPVLTKAGGFGTTSTLLDVLNFIEEKGRE